MPTSTTINATGGTVTTATANGWIIKTHTFTSSGSFVVTGAGASDVIEYIVVGGGGGGTFNNYIGSGGGGAEVKYANSVVTNSTYTITVGAGGTAKAMGSYGGGGAGGSSNIAGGITLGALGGPGSGMNGNPDATGTYTYGTSTAYYGAGAGGAGGAGVAGNGGAGKLINTGIFSNNPTYYGGGGAAGLASASGLTTLTGGSGGGANTILASGGQPAGTNSGGGGAGGSQMQSTPASDGAAGVVKISYYTTTAVGVFSNVSTVTSGGSIQFTLYSANTGNIPYTISGVTSAQISNASLTGNFVMSSGSGSFTVVTSSTASMGPVYTLSLSADGSTSNVNITPNVTILTSTILESNYSTMLVPLPGQLNIPHVGANAITDPSLQTKQNIVLSNSMMANKVVVPVTTSTTTNPSGPLTSYVTKPMGNDPYREFWM